MAAKPQPFTQDDAIAMVWEAVIDGRYANAPEAARAMWDDIVPYLSAEELRHLAILGLIELAKDLGHPKQQNPPPVRFGAPSTPKGWEQYATLHFPYLDGAQKQKPLIDFTIGDWQAFELRMQAAITPFARRAKMAKKVVATLIEHGAATLRELPPTTLAEMEALASDTLRAHTGS